MHVHMHSHTLHANHGVGVAREKDEGAMADQTVG